MAVSNLIFDRRENRQVQLRVFALTNTAATNLIDKWASCLLMAQYCFKWRIDMYTSHSEGHVWILVHAKALISARMSWYFDNPYNARTHAVSISILFYNLPFEILRRLAQFVLILEVFWQNLCLSDCSINNLRISPWFSWSLVVAVDKSFGTLCETQKFWSVFWSICIVTIWPGFCQSLYFLKSCKKNLVGLFECSHSIMCSFFVCVGRLTITSYSESRQFQFLHLSTCYPHDFLIFWQILRFADTLYRFKFYAFCHIVFFRFQWYFENVCWI